MPQNISRHSILMSPKDCLLLFILSLLWGSSFFFIKISIKEIPPLSLVFFRVTFASILLNAYLLIKKNTLPRDIKTWLIFILLGSLGNFIPFTLISWSEKYISSSLASILNATTPLWTVFISHIATHDEKFSFNKIIGILLGFSGVFIMIGPSAFNNNGNLREGFIITFSQIAVVIAALFYAIAIVFGRRLLTFSPMQKKPDPLVMATGQITGASIVMLPVVYFVDNPLSFLPSISMASWISVICLAFLGTSLAYALFYRLISSAGATNTSLVTFLAPMNAVLLGIGILGERLSFITIIGMAIILGSLLIVDGRLFRRRR